MLSPSAALTAISEDECDTEVPQKVVEDESSLAQDLEVQLPAQPIHSASNDALSSQMPEEQAEAEEDTDSQEIEAAVQEYLDDLSLILAEQEDSKLPPARDPEAQSAPVEQ